MVTVLIVDDDPAIGRLLGIILATENIGVERVESGPAALEHLNNGKPQPDVILLDLMMPGMDGREVFQEVRRAGITTPIVFCSAFGADSAMRELGADGAINKPFNPATLVASVRELAEGSKSHRS